MNANTYIILISIALAIATYSYFKNRAGLTAPLTTFQGVLKFVKYFFVMSAYQIVITLGYAFAAVSYSQATNNTADQMSQNDTAVVAEFKGYTQAWNQTTGKILAGYLDPSVSAENWVAATNSDLPRLRGIYIKMATAIVLIDDKGMKSTYSKFVGNYKEKLAGLTNLHIATAQGNEQGVKNASIEIDTAAKRGQVMALEYIEKVKKQVDPEIFRKMVKESADTSARAIQPAQ